MDAHQRELEEALKRQDKERTKKIDDLRKKLAERRRRREAELRAKHVQEVSQYTKDILAFCSIPKYLFKIAYWIEVIRVLRSLLISWSGLKLQKDCQMFCAKYFMFK